MTNTESEFLDLKIKLIETQKVFALVKYLNKVGHESNNHVSTISAGLQLSITRIQPTESLYKIVERSLECSNKIAKTFKDFQLFKQFNKLQKSSFPVSEVINEAVKLISHKYSSKNPEITVVIEDGLQKIDADYSQLLQVLFHSLENSIDASVKSCVISISVKSEKREAKTGIVILIEDKGRGIPEIIKVQLFQPFATSKMGSSSGLGLFLINSIILEHGGEVTADSNSEGTKLFLFLPV